MNIGERIKQIRAERNLTQPNFLWDFWFHYGISFAQIADLIFDHPTLRAPLRRRGMGRCVVKNNLSN